MTAVRQRKLLEENDIAPSHSVPSSPRSSRTSKGSGRWSKRFLCLLCFGFLSMCFLGMYYSVLPWKISRHATNILDNAAFMVGLHKHRYAVIIDAGSTGSRVLAFTFHEPIFDVSEINICSKMSILNVMYSPSMVVARQGEKIMKLDGELFYQIKPGLSHFADNPQEGAEHLKVLIEKAQKEIPAEAWASTPLAMKATAGLRLLPKGKADGLLNAVSKLFADSPFLTNKNSVGIMDGVDEGLFSWFTVNFLQDRMGSEDTKTAAALDLGGGSTQITFALTDVESLKQTNPTYLHNILAFHRNITVYTHSYLGLGLMAARKEILSVDDPEGATDLHSECVNPIINTEWSYGGKTYKVKGSKNPKYLNSSLKGVAMNKPIVRFEKCQQIIKDYVSKKVDKPKELNTIEINAFSYYFDRATEAGLIDPFLGGRIKVSKFQQAAVTSCATPNTEQPFMCLDLSFISILLQNGFGLDSSKDLNLFKKIDGHEISWALGAAFHILQNGL